MMGLSELRLGKNFICLSKVENNFAAEKQKRNEIKIKKKKKITTKK